MGEKYEYGMWLAVIFNIALITIFVLSFLTPAKKKEWYSLGLFEAFIITLFTEMYGFPLTIFVLTSLFKNILPENPFLHINGHLLASLFLGPQYAMSVCTLGGIFMLGGLVIMGIGWRQLHRARGDLVTGGIYQYLRHPQYLGIILLSSGMLLQWPTLPSLIMWPILLIVYYRLAKREEKEMEERFGERYLFYKIRTPAFIPFIKVRTNSLES